jgi:hypothetical protein
MSRWWNSWLLPVILLGSVLLVSRPAVCAAWLAACTVAARGINGWVAEHQGRTAPGTHLYLRKPS